MGDQPSQIEQYLDMIFAYGPVWAYVIIFAACFVENIFPPFPGDTFIVAGGALVALGRLELYTTLTVVVLGGMSSVMVLYAVGRNFGRDYFARKNYKFISTTDIERLEVKLAQWGAIVLLLSRFVAGFRSALAVVAGIGKYPPVKMAIYSSISYVVFAGLLVFLAAKLVSNLDVIESLFKTYNMIVWPTLLLVVVLYVVRKYRATNRKRVG